MSGSKSVFETILDLFAGIRIILSPLLISAIPAAIVYFKFDGWVKNVVPLILLFAGLIIGFIWAIRVNKSEGTFTFMTRVNRSPELDKITQKDIDQMQRRKEMENENSGITEHR